MHVTARNLSLLISAAALIAALAAPAHAAVYADARANYLAAPAGSGTAAFNGGTGLSDTLGTGRWNYYQSTTANPALGTLTALAFKGLGNAGTSGYGGTDSYQMPGLADAKLFTDGGTITASELSWHPGNSGATHLVARWTAGAGETGDIRVLGDIRELGSVGNGTTLQVFNSAGEIVYDPGVVINTNAGTHFEFDTTIAPGQSLYFVSGNNGAWEGDHSALSGIHPAAGRFRHPRAGDYGPARLGLRRPGAAVTCRQTKNVRPGAHVPV